MHHPARAGWCQTARMAPASRPVLVLDSASLYYRSFYALPEKMTAPDGRPHNAVRGFLSTLTRLVDAHAPAGVVACWDNDWRPAWRVDLVPSYKAHRVADGRAAGARPSRSRSVRRRSRSPACSRRSGSPGGGWTGTRPTTSSAA